MEESKQTATELQGKTPVVTPPILNEEELKERAFDLSKIYQIAQVRESPHPQFDGMGYMKYNETNEMADISYLPPKLNKMDRRIVSGITHEKDSSLLSMVQNFNFEGKVRIFKGDEEQYDLSNAITAWVRKSRELENYDEKRPIYYRNLLVQGTSFAQEKFVERYIPKKVVTTENIDFNRLDEVTWVAAGWDKVYDGCVSDLVDGKKVFLEDIRQSDIRKQPGVYTVEYVPREWVRSIWQDNPRWKHVPFSCTPGSAIGLLTQATRYSDWTYAEVDFSKVEVMQVHRPLENRYQIYLNGVPMLKAGFPLQVVSPSRLTPIAKGDLDQMNMFAYSKSIPAKTKIDQAVYDNFMRVMMIKFEQSAFVPRGNLTNKYVDPYIMMPGRYTDDVDPKLLPPLIENPGPTNADFSILNMIREGIDNKSVSALLEGNMPSDSTMTLGQYLDMQKKQMLKLGTIFDAFINWEKQMLHLRTCNLIANGAKPMGKIKSPYTGNEVNNYKDVSVDDSFGDASGTRVLKFTDENYEGIRTPLTVAQEEIAKQKETGKEVRYSYLNPALLKDMLSNPEWYFCYEVVPVDKNNDKLSQALFVAMISQAANLFGMESLQVDGLKRRFASKFGEDFDTLFRDPRDMEIAQQMQQQASMAAAAAKTSASPNAEGISTPTTSSMPQVQEMFK